MCAVAGAQDLEPRAYSVSPVGTNFVIWTFTHSAGDLVFDPTLPVEDARGKINGAALAGRSGNLTVVIPYVWGTAQGRIAGEPTQIYRSGIADWRFRHAVNIRGAPARSNSRARTNLGVSVVMLAPTGQYDSNKIVNVGNNRWSFKPEIGISGPAVCLRPRFTGESALRPRSASR